LRGPAAGRIPNYVGRDAKGGKIVRAATPRAKTGPLPQVPWRNFEPAMTLEHHLPKVLVLMFAALLLIQLWLHI